MPGSFDNEKFKIVDARKTLLSLSVHPDGAVDIQSSQSKTWVAETLRRIANEVEPAEQQA